MVPVGGKLWCGSQNRVLIINTTTLVQEVGGGGGHIMTQTDNEVSVTLHVSSHPSVSALVPGGHRQQSVRDLHGGVRSGCVVGVARQCAGPTVPRSELGEPDGGGRGACRA